MKKTTLAKFTNIAYPIFTTKYKPYEICYDLHKIYCVRKANGHRETVDDKTLSGDYFARLLQLERRITFDYTCKNLQDVIYSKSKWGMDKNAMPHNFSRTFMVPAEKRRVSKIQGNILWLRNISYPFELPTQENISLNDTLYATIVLVNKEWYIREFSLDSALEVPYYYV